MGMCTLTQTPTNTHTHTYTQPLKITDTKPPLLLIPSPPAVKISPPSNPHRSAQSSVSAGSLEWTCRLLVCAERVLWVLLYRPAAHQRVHTFSGPDRNLNYSFKCQWKALHILEQYEVMNAVKVPDNFGLAANSKPIGSFELKIILQSPVQKQQTGSISFSSLLCVKDCCSSAHISLSRPCSLPHCPLFSLSLFLHLSQLFFSPTLSCLPFCVMHKSPCRCQSWTLRDAPERQVADERTVTMLLLLPVRA